MTKLEAWKAWCAQTGIERFALESTLEQSSHGKAFSFAWDAAAKAERDLICTMLDDLHKQEERHNYYGFISRMIKEMK